MRETPSIVRDPMHTQVLRVLEEWILTGRIPAGSVVNEARLAQDLGVSRTPLREALARLERDGILTVVPRRGIFVAPLTRRDAEQLYPILVALESLALRSLPSGTLDLPHLARLNRAFARQDPEDTVAVLAANEAWHAALLAPNPNAALHGLIRDLRTRIARYEYAYFLGGEASIRRSVAEHEAIGEALRDGAVERAVDLLTRHYLSDLAALLPRVPEVPTADLDFDPPRSR